MTKAEKAAERRVAEMRRWAKKAGPGFRQPASAALKQAVTEALRIGRPASENCGNRSAS